jgi:SP family sugar:H+ symporter-like MFS transporter
VLSVPVTALIYIIYVSLAASSILSSVAVSMAVVGDGSALLLTSENAEQSGDEEEYVPPTAFARNVCILTGLGGIFFGYDQGVSGGMFVMNSFIEDWCTKDVVGAPVSFDECSSDLNTQPSGWINFQTIFTALLNLGAMLGALGSNFTADRFGRRATIATACIAFTIGTILQAFIPTGRNYTLGILYFARIVDGYGVGAASFILPLFAAEVAPAHIRGLLSGLMQFAVVFGIVLAGLANLIFENSPNGWRYSTSVALVPCIVVLFGTIFFVPESPRWLLSHKGEQEARVALCLLREVPLLSPAGSRGMALVEQELEEIKAAAEEVREQQEQERQRLQQQQQQRGSGSDVAATSYCDVGKWLGIGPEYMARLRVVCTLMFFQQCTGVNPVLTYGGLIIKDIGLPAVLGLVIVQGTNFFSTVLLFYFNGLDNLGRRTLLLVGALGMSASLVAAGAAYNAGCSMVEQADEDGGTTTKTECANGAGELTLVAICFFIFFFAVTWGGACWVYPPEIFPTHVRAKAVSISTLSNWALGTLMSFALGVFQALGVGWTFILFGCSCLLSFAFVYHRCPETKGRSLEEIERLFVHTNEARAETMGAGVGESGGRAAQVTMDRHSLTLARADDANGGSRSQSVTLLHTRMPQPGGKKQERPMSAI